MSEAAPARNGGVRDEAPISFAELASIVGGRWLDAPPSGAFAGVGIDSRERLEGRVFLAIKGERFDGHDFLGAAASSGALAAIVERERASGSAETAPSGAGSGHAAVASHGAPCPRLLVASAREALTALAREWRARLPASVAAITGSCGKTTTRRLLASILERIGPTVQSPKSFNNDLGVPLTLLSARLGDRFVVAEVGMNRPGEIRPLAELVRPHVAVITSVGRVHLEALGSVDAIAREKASIVQGLVPDGVIVAPAESAIAMNAVMEAIERRLGDRIRVMTFGLAAGDARLRGRRIAADSQVIELDGPWGRIDATLRLPGEHNAMNALAAALAAHRLGADARAISAGLAAVSASEMRFVRQAIDGIEVVNDAYNANPESMRASIRAFAESSSAAQRRVVVLGDMLELGDAAESLHRELGEWLPEAIAGGPPELAIFVGPLSAAASRAFARAAPESESLHLPDAGAASAESLRAVLRAGDSVLFKASRGVALERLIAALAAPGAGAGAGAVAGARSSAESETRAGPRPRAGGSR